MVTRSVSFEDFVSKYHALRHQRRLFAFLLCDDRPSHRGIQKFADANSGWLDQLAHSAKIFFFIFGHKAKAREGVKNPSLKVASLFGIRPNQLPGIVLFTVVDERDGAVNRALYLPLHPSLFGVKDSITEEVFADLFAGVQSCLQSTSTEEDLWPALEAVIGEVRMKGKWHVTIQHLQFLATLPVKFLESMVAALGEGAAKRLTGG